MKLLKTIRENHAFLGISSNQTLQSNVKIVVTALFYGTGFTLSTVYLCREASTFAEYINNMYITTGLALAIFIHTIVVFQMDDFFEFVNECDVTFGTSKYAFSKESYLNSAKTSRKTP